MCSARWQIFARLDMPANGLCSSTPEAALATPPCAGQGGRSQMPGDRAVLLLGLLAMAFCAGAWGAETAEQVSAGTRFQSRRTQAATGAEHGGIFSMVRGMSAEEGGGGQPGGDGCGSTRWWALRGVPCACFQKRLAARSRAARRLDTSQRA